MEVPNSATLVTEGYERTVAAFSYDNVIFSRYVFGRLAESTTTAVFALYFYYT
jgi:hypothetical protein